MPQVGTTASQNRPSTKKISQTAAKFFSRSPPGFDSTRNLQSGRRQCSMPRGLSAARSANFGVAAAEEGRGAFVPCRPCLRSGSASEYRRCACAAQGSCGLWFAAGGGLACAGSSPGLFLLEELAVVEFCVERRLVVSVGGRRRVVWSVLCSFFAADSGRAWARVSSLPCCRGVAYSSLRVRPFVPPF